MLKEGVTILSKHLSIIFNRSLLQGYFPSNWKDANVTAIYKKADKSMPSNYRPISLLSQIGIAMERCIHKHLYNYRSIKKVISLRNISKVFFSHFLIHLSSMLYHTCNYIFMPFCFYAAFQRITRQHLYMNIKYIPMKTQ